MILAIAQIKNQEDCEFLGCLYREHYRTLLSVAQSVIDDHNLAEDIVNDTMLSLFSLVPKLRSMDECSRVAYLIIATKSHAVTAYNKRKRKSAAETFLSEEQLYDIPDFAPGPGQILEDHERRSIVQKVMASLSPKQRYILYCTYILEQTSDEIAHSLRLRPASIRKELTRARRKAEELFLREWRELV